MVGPLRIESLCARIFWNLLRRNPRYVAVILPMYALSVVAPVRCHFLRAAYCFARYADDLLDGDEVSSGCPRELVTSLFYSAGSGSVRDSTLSRLGLYVLEALRADPDTAKQSTDALTKLVGAMVFDYDRARSKAILTQAELRGHHNRTFCNALTVALHVAGARFSDEDVRAAARVQGCLYTLRDLPQDLDRGIINVPDKVVALSRLQGAGSTRHKELWATAAYREWIRRELEQGECGIVELRCILRNHRDFKFRATVFPLYWGLKSLPGKVKRMYSIVDENAAVPSDTTRSAHASSIV